MTNRSFLNSIAYFSVAILFSTILLILYWQLYPYKVLSFNPGNGTILNPVVKSGGYLQVVKNRCKYMSVVASVDRKFIDGLEYQVPPIISDIPLGCKNNVELTYVPKALPPGNNYKLQDIVKYQVNPIRSIEYKVVTQKFTIIK
jgi:hypothetical protein